VYTDVIVYEKQTAQSDKDISVPDTSPGGSLNRYFSYFLLSVLWLNPFRNHVALTRNLLWSAAQIHEIQAYTESIW